MNRTTVGWLLVAVQFALLLTWLLLPWREPTAGSVGVGSVLVVTGGGLGLMSARRLGRALTATPVPIQGAGLRTDGAYRLVRHPIYAAVLLIVLGLDVAIGSMWSWAWSLVILVFFWAKSRWEDGLLEREYGEAWRQWAARTGALVPRLRA